MQTRQFDRDDTGRRAAIKWATIDSTIALMLALFVNAAILVVAAAVFHANGKTDVAEIEDAYSLLSPLLGVGIASVLFAIALFGIRSQLDGHGDPRRTNRHGGICEFAFRIGRDACSRERLPSSPSW